MIERILKNTGSNVIVLIVKLAITFIMTPIFVHSLGNYDYGIWEMVLSIVGYMGMLDLGLKPAVLRYAAKYNAENNRQQLKTLYATTCIFMGAIGFLLFVFFISWGFLKPDLLAPDTENISKYFIFLLIIGVQLLFSFPGYVAESFLEGFQRYQIKNNIILVNTIIGSTILYFGINESNGLWLLALVNGVGACIKYVLYMLLLRFPKYGQIKFQSQYFSFSYLKEILSFGFKSFIQGAATRIESGSDVVIIGAILGPAVVVFYSLPSALVKHVRNLAWTLTHAMMPVFSDLHARGEHEKSTEVLLGASRVVAGILLPLGIAICIMGAPFIAVWMGPNYAEEARPILLLLVVFYLLPFINPFSSRYLTSIGKHGIFAIVNPISAVLNIILSIILARQFGIVGVAAASVVPGLIAVPLILRYTCLHLKISVFHYVYRVLLPLVFPVVTFFILMSLAVKYFIPDSYFIIISTCITCGFVYLMFFMFFSMQKHERKYLLSFIKK